MIFQDGCHSISVIFSEILFNTSIDMSTVTLFTKFHVNSLSIIIYNYYDCILNPTSAISKMAAVPANFNFRLGP